MAANGGATDVAQAMQALMQQLDARVAAMEQGLSVGGGIMG